MSFAKPIIISAGVLLIVYAVYNYYTVEQGLLTNSNYQLNDVSFDSFTLDEVKLNLSCQFDNESDINITLRDLYLDIYINDKYVGYVLQSIESNINPKSSNIIPIKASINISGVLSSSIPDISLLFNKGKVNVKATGTVSVSSGFISTKMPISFQKDVVI